MNQDNSINVGESFASQEFEKIIWPINRETFFKEFWTKKFLYLERADHRFENLFSWNELNKILENHRLDYPRLRLAKEGFAIAPKEYTHYMPTKVGINIPYILSNKLNEKLVEGATLIIDAVDELCDQVKELAQVLESTFNETIHGNAYVGWGNTTGLDIHWDDHDVLILQIFGKKQWSIYGETIKYPLVRNIISELQKPQKPIWEKIVHAGDILYIPRGYWHNVIPCNEPSIHLTFGIQNRNGTDLANWIASKLIDDEFFRKDIPYLEDSNGLQAYKETFDEKIQNFFKNNFIGEYLTDHRENAVIRPRFSLPHSVVKSFLDPNKKLNLNINWRFKFVINEQNKSIYLTYGGEDFNFKLDLKPLFDLLTDRNSCTIAEAMTVLDYKENNLFDNTIKKLLETGLFFLSD